jgi:hypothetical protein
MTCRKRIDDVKTGGKSLPRDKSGRRPDCCPDGIRHEGGVKLSQAFAWNMGTCRPDAKGEIQAGGPRKDDDRRAAYPNRKFDFLGYTFRPRLARRKGGKVGVSFSPAVSTKAIKKIGQTVRGWALHLRSDKSLEDLARMFNSHIRGWINYYGRFYPSALYPTLRRIDVFLARWAFRKFKSLNRHKIRAIHWLQRIARHQTWMFAHWGLLFGRGRTTGAV